MASCRSKVMSAALAVLTLAACGQSSDAPAQNAAGPGQAQSLVVAISGDEGTLTPYTYVRGYPGYSLLGLVYDTLLVLDEDSVPQPHLATSIEVSDDGLTYRMPLADGVTWHDGVPLTAKDVVFTYNYVRENVSDRFTKPASAAVDVQAEGNTVVFTLAEPNPEFVFRPLSDLPIMPAHIWSEISDPEAATVEQAVGSGPYRLVDYRPDQSYGLEANEDYALGSARVDRLTLSVVPEEQTALAALRSGEVQAVTGGVPPQLVDSLSGQDGLEVVSGPEFSSSLLLMNNERAPFDDPAVRRAVSLAIDVEDLVATVLLGKGTAGDEGFVHPDVPQAGTRRPHEYDLQEAARLLDGAGATAGADGVRAIDGRRMAFSLLVYADDPADLRSAELIRDGLAEVGVELTITPADPDSVDARVWPDFDVASGRDFEMAMWGWSAPVMLDSTQYAALVESDTTSGTLNVQGTRDSELDASAAALRSAGRPEERTAAVDALAGVIAERTPFVTLYYEDGTYAYDAAEFDGWVFQTGQGILNKQSLAELD